MVVGDICYKKKKKTTRLVNCNSRKKDNDLQVMNRKTRFLESLNPLWLEGYGSLLE